MQSRVQDMVTKLVLTVKFFVKIIARIAYNFHDSAGSEFPVSPGERLWREIVLPGTPERYQWPMGFSFAGYP